MTQICLSSAEQVHIYSYNSIPHSKHLFQIMMRLYTALSAGAKTCLIFPFSFSVLLLNDVDV